MEAPLCSICNQKHFGAKHIWPKENANVRASGTNIDDLGGETGDGLPKPKTGGKSESGMLGREVPKEGVKRADRVDDGAPKLSGGAIHQEVQEGGRAVPGKKDSTSIPEKVKFDRTAYQREYMRKRRANP